MNPNAVGSAFTDIRKISEHVARMEHAPIRLDIGEPDLPESEHVKRAAIASVRSGSHYTPSAGAPYVRRIVADFMTARRDVPVDPEHVVMTLGATGAITLSLFVLLEPGDEVLVPEPGFPNYTILTRQLGGVPIPYHLWPEQGWQPDPEEIASLSTERTRAMIVCSPSNPLGQSVSRDAFASVLKVARDRDFRILADEVYDRLIFEGEPLRAYAMDPERVIGIYSFSKDYSMTGYRIGFALAPSDMSVPMAKSAATIMNSPSSIAQDAAVAALTGSQDDVGARRDEYRRRRDAVDEFCATHDIDHWRPSATFYDMIALHPGTDSLQFAFDLIDQGVSTVPGTAFGVAGTAGTSYLRLSLTQQVPKLLSGLQIIAEAVEQHRRS